MLRPLFVVALGWYVAVVADDKGAGAQEARSMTFSLTSGAFTEGGAIPKRCTCEGENGSLPLAWTGVPAGTKSLVLIVDEPDAPDPAAPNLTWMHGLLYDLPPTARGLEQAVAASALPTGTRQGVNDWKRTGYGGPCLPVGRHRYFHKLYALDAVLGDLRRPDKAALEAAMKGHVLAQVQLIGTYQKGQ